MRGITLIEVMISTALMSSFIVCVLLLSSGTQNLLVDSEAQSGALAQAQAVLEQMKVIAQKDFTQIQSLGTTTSGMYISHTEVGPWSGDVYHSKIVRVITQWQSPSGQLRQVQLTQIFTDYQNALTGDTCGASEGNWSHAVSTHYAMAQGILLPWLAPVGHTFSIASPVSSLDAYHGYLYVGIATTTNKTNDSLFIFKTNGNSAPTYASSIDTNSASIDGVAALQAVGNYLYVANPHTTTWKTCHSGPSCAQLYIYTISNLPTLSQPITFLVPTSTPVSVLGSGGQAVGNALAISNGYVYLGLTKTSTGPEFNIIDVHDPAHPLWMGGYAVGAGVESIVIKGANAYVATADPAKDMLTLDISDPHNPRVISSYDVPDISHWSNGNTLYKNSGRVFLGLTFATSTPDVQIFGTVSSTPVVFATYKTGGTNQGMILRGSTLAVLTSTLKQLQLIDISDIAHIYLQKALSLPGIGTAIDCESNILYIGSQLSQGYVSLIYPQ